MVIDNVQPFCSQLDTIAPDSPAEEPPTAPDSPAEEPPTAAHEELGDQTVLQNWGVLVAIAIVLLLLISIAVGYYYYK